MQAKKVGADTVHLVDERQTRNVVLVGLAPDRLGLRLHPADRTEDGDRAVEHPERTFDFSGEVHVSRGVDDIDAVFDRSEGPTEGIQAQEMAAAVMVMPRSRSCSIQSVTVVPSWTSPILWTAPE